MTSILSSNRKTTHDTYTMLEDNDLKKLGYFFYNIYYDVFDTETKNLMIKLLLFYVS